ncbi:MAG: hypothetical protein HOP23_04850 [Methylococcaceae bacterium]|nr:hypothetical protein [Methylococcaceae bacterium]
MLKIRLQQTLISKDLAPHRALAKSIVDEMGIDAFDLAAALIYLCHDSSQIPAEEKNNNNQTPIDCSHPELKMVRYRLDVGSQNQITLETIKNLLVNESGVDKNNIRNITIQGQYTLLDLPDNMPQDIFLHLKTVEINQHKLDIKRVKPGNTKRRGKNRSRRARQRHSKIVHGPSDQVNGG